MTISRIDCWVVTPDRGSDARCLAREEHRHAAGMRSAAARARFVAGRLVLREVVGSYLGLAPADVPLVGEPGSAPRLAGRTDVHLGLSHADRYVAVAVGPVRLGVDVEVAGRREVPARACPPAKRWALASLVGASARATAAWVAQEAALKADGIGLAFPLDRVVLAPFASGLRVTLDGRGSWGVTLLQPAEDVVVAVASDGPPPAVTLHRTVPCRTSVASVGCFQTEGCHHAAGLHGELDVR